MSNPIETPLESAVAAALSGTTDPQTGTIFNTIGDAEYYTADYRKEAINNRILATVNQLRVVKDGNLTFGVWSGQFHDGQTLRTFAGVQQQSLTDDAVNYIYLKADGTLVVNTSGFVSVSDDPHIPLAEIATGTQSVEQLPGQYTHADIVDCRGRSLMQVLSAAGGQALNTLVAGAASDCDALHTHGGKEDVGVAGTLVTAHEQNHDHSLLHGVDDVTISLSGGNAQVKDRSISDVKRALATVESSTATVSSPNSLMVYQSRKTLVNTDATELNVHQLPDALVGTEYRFVVINTNGIRVIAATGDRIRIDSSESADGGYVESTALGAVVHLLAVSESLWVAVSVTGTWQVQ